MQSENQYSKVKCPVMNKAIEEVVCFDICLVAEGTSPESELPIGFTLTDELAQRCLNCPNHID